MGDILFSPTEENSLRETYAISSVMGNNVQDLITFSSSSSDEGPETLPGRTDSLITLEESVLDRQNIDSASSDVSEPQSDSKPIDLKRAECRAQFWENYAKQILLMCRFDQCQNNVGEIRADHEKQRDQSIHSSEERLNDMAIQMRELGESLNQLKMHGEEEEKRIQHLEAELKRTERIKNSYKKEISSLKSLLEESTKHVVARPHNDSAAMQSKISSLRIHIESLKGRVDKIQAEKNVLQGEHEELKDRCHRREEALERAQKRCRDLEMQIKKSVNLEENIMPHTYQDIHSSRETTPRTDICATPISCEDEGCSLPLESSLQSSPMTSSHNTREAIVYVDASTSMEETNSPRIGQEEHIIPPEAMQQDDEEKVNQEQAKEEEEESRPCDSMIHETLYRNVFGNVDVSNAEAVILKADETLERCTSSIKLLLEKLQAAEDEANQLQSLCANQYDQIYSYKNTCSHLHAKKVHLENYIARLEQSSSEYQDQMDRLLANQRHAAAHESHHLHQELQLMSEEQARLLVKLQAAENDLVKARALCQQLSSSTPGSGTRAVEQPDAEDNLGRSISSSPGDNDSIIPSAIYPGIQKQMPPHEDSSGRINVVQRLQTIAQGLKNISSSGAVEQTEIM